MVGDGYRRISKSLNIPWNKGKSIANKKKECGTALKCFVDRK